MFCTWRMLAARRLSQPLEILDTLQTIQGYRVKQRKGMVHWEPLLEEWLLANARYCRVMDGDDAAYIYRERTQIGILSGAAWRCGRIALEETPKEKGHRNKTKWLGRTDLYMATEDTEELIEAKYKWLSLNSTQLAELAIKALGEALKDAKLTRSNDKDLRCIGLVFLPVYLPPSSQKSIDEKIASAIEEISSLKCHSVAWFFPKEFRAHKDGYKNIIPGVFMLASNLRYA
jgi:hypothetical protein